MGCSDRTGNETQFPDSGHLPGLLLGHAGGSLITKGSWFVQASPGAFRFRSALSKYHSIVKRMARSSESHLQRFPFPIRKAAASPTCVAEIGVTGGFEWLCGASLEAAIKAVIYCVTRAFPGCVVRQARNQLI
ncbi:MAG TPA: hypothetical protein VIM06_09855 [Rhodanobacter sp.]